MPVTKGVWGIDIGQCALKALRLEMIDGQPTATAFDYVEHPKILSQPDADPDQLIREALEKFLSRNEIKHDDVAIGIAGQSGLARFVKLPPVEEKKIAEIVKFEAKQQIPFPLDEVVWDFQKIAGGEVTDGFAMETEIGLFAMKRDVISRYLGYFGGSKIECHVVQMSPLALVNFATYEILKKGGTNPPPEEPPPADAPRNKKRCVVVLDIGTDASNLIITDGGKIIWQRPVPLGGNNFTRALTKELKLTFAKGEHLKRNAAKSPELPQILKAIKPVLTDFVGEVQRSLGYFTNTHRDAHVASMVGLGSAFRLPGLQKYLAEKLTLDVKKPEKFARLSGDAVLNDPLFKENMLTFPVAYGLALQGLGEARLTTNLLPTEIRTDRLIRAKKPYAVAAAAALLLGTGGLALGYSSNLASVQNKKIEDALKVSKDAVAASTNQDSKYSTKKGEVDTTMNDVKSIIAGSDERLNWPRFEEVLSASLPRPGKDGNLPPEIWNVDRGAQAVEWFMNRMRNGVPVERAIEDDRSAYPAYLAMVNVEAVHCRWVDKLGDLYASADDTVFRTSGYSIGDTMKDDERERDAEKDRWKPKAPSDGGAWVIEIRGYTDHNKPTFVRDALARNLQKMDTFATKGENKVGTFVPGVTDPIKGKISHAFVYGVWRQPRVTIQANSFLYINKSYLDGMVGGGGGGGAFGGPGGVPGVPGGPPGRGAGPAGEGGEGGPGAAVGAGALGPGWTPLTSAGGSMSGGAGGLPGEGGSGFGGPRSSGGPGSIAPPSGGPSAAGGGGPGSIAPPTAGPSAAGGTPGGFPGGVPGGSGGAAPPNTAKGDTEGTRYEFVVMFIWREPIPTSGGATPPAEAPPTGGN